jgi:hypothetical protein
MRYITFFTVLLSSSPFQIWGTLEKVREDLKQAF